MSISVMNKLEFVMETISNRRKYLFNVKHGAWTRALFVKIEKEIDDSIWIKVYHHKFSSNKKIYEEPLEQYRTQKDEKENRTI